MPLLDVIPDVILKRFRSCQTKVPGCLLKCSIQNNNSATLDQ